MKVPTHHYEHLRDSMAVIKDRLPAHVERVRQNGKFKSLEKRVLWDWMRAAELSPFICNVLYKEGINDVHLETALRRSAIELIPDWETLIAGGAL
jgi:hypothetical protein